VGNSIRDKENKVASLIENKLSESTRIQLEHAANIMWTLGHERTNVTDLIDVTSKEGHIIINPFSDKEKPLEVAGAFDGKAVIYAAFKFILDEYAGFFPGRHETSFNYATMPRTRKAVSFRTDEHGRWHCYRVQNGGLVEIKFRDLPADADPYDVYLRDNYQNTHDMVDLVMLGAYCDIDLTEAPQLYAYFLGLLAQTSEEAKATIETHENNKIANNDAQMSAQAVKEIGRITAVKGGLKFTAQSSNLSHLAFLQNAGYTLSA
jgi:hypothetical protein